MASPSAANASSKRKPVPPTILPAKIKIETVPIDSLVPDKDNARTHSEKNLEAIKGSLVRFGQQKPIVVKGNVVVAGNGTLEAAKALGWKSIAVVESKLVGADLRAFALADNRTAELAMWDVERLTDSLKFLGEEWDFDISDIGFLSEDVSAFNRLRDLGDGKDDGDYTKKIEAPIYEITGEKPAVSSLVDLTKTKALLKGIEEAKLPADVKAFLQHAARRHTVFAYDKIAEYYAHAPAEVQALFEASALVIIDFKKAIEGGFVALSEELGEAYADAT